MDRMKATTATRPSGQRKPKPPRGVPNDGNFAHLYSGNILYDPGVELFVGNAVGSWSRWDWIDRTGNPTFMLPNYEPTCEYNQIWPNDDCVTYWDIAQWVSQGSSYTPDGGVDTVSWNVTRDDPFLGDFAMAFWRWSKGPGGNPLNLMIQAPGLPGGYSARVQSGDNVAFSARVRVHPPQPYATECDPRVSVMLYYYNQSGTPIVGGGNHYQTLTTSYQERSYTTIAPGGSYFVRAFLSFTAQDPAELALHDPAVLVDSGVLSVE